MVLVFSAPRKLNKNTYETKKLFVVLSLSCLCLCASAQKKDHRDPGFRGYAAITDQLGVFVGDDFSLGHMFDRKNYLGLGVSAFTLPSHSLPFYGNVFGEYRHYFKESKNSMFIGSKAGFSHSFKYDEKPGITFKNGIMVEPNFGWSWGLKSGNALELLLGVNLTMPVGERRTSRSIMPLPKIGFAFSF